LRFFDFKNFILCLRTSIMALHPDDPRLTDYALGELDAAARAELERELAESPEARAALEEIQRVTGLLGASLAEEDHLVLDSARRAAILAC
jgi:anti-sigma factor RsiW